MKRKRERGHLVIHSVISKLPVLIRSSPVFIVDVEVEITGTVVSWTQKLLKEIFIRHFSHNVWNNVLHNLGERKSSTEVNEEDGTDSIGREPGE